MTAQQVSAGVQRVSYGISNWYLVEDAGAVVCVDAGTPADWQQLTRGLERLGHSLAAVEAVLLTHAHSDHTGFAERARQEAGASVHVHQADAEAARTGKPGRGEGGMARYLLRAEAYRTIAGLSRRGALRIVPVREVAVFEADEILDVPGRPRVIHAPGHTAGSSALWFESRDFVCSGDAIVTRNPLTGRRGPQIMPTAFNESTDQAMASLDAFASVRADLVLPGHGEPWRGTVADAVQHARAAGRS
jgi:glyoxylase-like metal-dependent hydrolase (beta-lactamase superfamily II)